MRWDPRSTNRTKEIYQWSGTSNKPQPWRMDGGWFASVWTKLTMPLDLCRCSSSRGTVTGRLLTTSLKRSLLWSLSFSWRVIWPTMSFCLWTTRLPFLRYRKDMGKMNISTIWSVLFGALWVHWTLSYISPGFLPSTTFLTRSVITRLVKLKIRAGPSYSLTSNQYIESWWKQPMTPRTQPLRLRFSCWNALDCIILVLSGEIVLEVVSEGGTLSGISPWLRGTQILENEPQHFRDAVSSKLHDPFLRLVVENS